MSCTPLLSRHPSLSAMAHAFKIEYASKDFIRVYYDEAPADVPEIIRGLAAEYLRNGMSMNDAMVAALHREDELYRLSLKNHEPDSEPDIDLPDPEYLEARVARHGRKKRKDTGSVALLPELTENDEPDAEFDDPEPDMEDL